MPNTPRRQPDRVVRGNACFSPKSERDREGRSMFCYSGTALSLVIAGDCYFKSHWEAEQQRLMLGHSGDGGGGGGSGLI